jgi:hypothetical protein
MKWPEAYAIPNQEASTVAEVLVSNFCRFGVPQEIHSEEGRNFEPRLIQEILQHLGVSKTRTTPLHPQSDGMVERNIKTVEEHLRCDLLFGTPPVKVHPTIYHAAMSSVGSRYQKTGEDIASWEDLSVYFSEM